MRDQFKGARQTLLSGYFPLIMAKPLITENHFVPPPLRKKIRKIIFDGVPKDNNYFLQIATAAVSLAVPLHFCLIYAAAMSLKSPPMQI